MIEVVTNGVLPNHGVINWGLLGQVAAPVVTITHVMNGTFSITFRGTNGAVIYIDPGNGSAVQEKTLLGPGTNVTFSYANAGVERNVLIWGALGSVTRFACISKSVTSQIEEFAKFSALDYLDASGNSMTGDISSIAGLALGSLTFYGNTVHLTYTGAAVLWGGAASFIAFHDCLGTADEVGAILIALNNAGLSSYLIYVDGTNPGAPGTPEVIAAIAGLSGRGCTVYAN